MTAIQRLQHWFIANCNGDWEHQSGIAISTLDNPGWSIDIDVEGTALVVLSQILQRQMVVRMTGFMSLVMEACSGFVADLEIWRRLSCFSSI
jgi:hypothetical protein